MGDSEAALLVRFYLLTATWGLMLVFSSPWGLVKLPANHHTSTQAKRQERPLKHQPAQILAGDAGWSTMCDGKIPIWRVLLVFRHQGGASRMLWMTMWVY